MQKYGETKDEFRQFLPFAIEIRCVITTAKLIIVYLFIQQRYVQTEIYENNKAQQTLIHQEGVKTTSVEYDKTTF